MVIHQEREFNALLEKKLGVNDQEKAFKYEHLQPILSRLQNAASRIAR